MGEEKQKTEDEELETENGVNQLVQDAIRNQQSRQYDQCSGESPG